MKLSRGNGTMPTQRNQITYLSAVAALMIAGVAYWTLPSSAESARRIPPAAVDETTGASREVTVLAGGCFWGVQGVFQHVGGVISAVSGYAGGSRDTAQYETTVAGPRAMRNRCRSPSTRIASPTAASSKSISQWCTTQPSSIARVPMSVRSIARPSSRKIPSRVG